MTETKIPKYWRSLEQLENSEEFQEFMHREFPVAASEFPAGVSRRRWLQLMGASFALASVAGCRWKTEKIAPLVERPEEYIPGNTQKYATTIELAGAPRHLLVTCYDGRPIKVEGNPDHPGSLGATDSFSQATTLSLYDPDRSSTVRQRLASDVSAKNWEDFETYFEGQLTKLRSGQGAGLAVLVEPSSSLTMAATVKKLADAMPQAKLYEYAPLDRTTERAGAEQAFGSKVRTHYKLADAKVIASFESDLLCGHPNATRYARDWAATRELGDDPAHPTMGRTYAVESQFSVIGAAADHRAAIKSSDIGAALAEVRDMVRQRLDGTPPEELPEFAERQKFVEKIEQAEHPRQALEDEKAPPVTAKQVLWALADDLAAHQGESVVAVGPRQPAEVHALAYELNSMLGNLGKTVVFTDEPEEEVEKGTISDLSAALDAGEVETLVIIGGNPVYDAPADLGLGKKIDGLVETIRLGYYEDETSELCQWHVPMCHPFETWGDSVSYEGMPSVSQPLIEPIYESLSPLQMIGKLAGIATGQPQVLVREAMSTVAASGLSDDAWDKLLHDGFVDSSVLTVANPSVVEGLDVKPPQKTDAKLMEVVFTSSASVYDGRFANNGWLQETPDFITKVTWDNVAIVSPHTAQKLRVKQGDVLAISIGEETIELPVYMLPGQANGSIGVQLGYGRTAAGAVGGQKVEGLSIPRFRRWWSPMGEPESIVVGTNVYPARTTDAMHVAQLEKEPQPAGKTYKLATTQDHFAIDKVGLEIINGRIGDLVRETSVEGYSEMPDFAAHVVHEVKTDPLFPDRTWGRPANEGEIIEPINPVKSPHAWGMSVDLNKCIGCNACLLACQSENNVPVVGKEQVAIGREMHWIRIDRYFRGMPDDFNSEDPESPQVATQMVTCQQCESAPCEEVCPVAATTHTDEGLNDMVYNRCVGTRYCANNCPYKVRRFNYFHMTGYMEKPENQLIQLVNNPEVTVRSRGVMEKCTFCTQRIAKARTDVRMTGKPIADGDIQTACQQACATRAIEFGDLRDEESRVSLNHKDPRAYGMLAELDVRPRNKYLAKVSNPHPMLAGPVVLPEVHGHHGEGGEHAEGGEHHEGEEHNGSEHGSDSSEHAARRDPRILPIIG
ncbi:TAT-variant-translocated molybdopterin oxidoreductase [Aeoliella sp. ICT_H6.2]|uniref:TAT-variant-translocated molybdopterin oxidoreductase n=1 Tax=Aeoliella straminimaris TaxID=2954799 RepID=A0A9X2F7D5_9BACT|nr:TAT-variant-translocated molybdopterin oxidoreductase [Aeoliella straminimaris]MCO6043038.1 TAT-variant-translocated molybdopterin oxidoreductase [Aeoliella straminimaris]